MLPKLRKLDMAIIVLAPCTLASYPFLQAALPAHRLLPGGPRHRRPAPGLLRLSRGPAPEDARPQRAAGAADGQQARFVIQNVPTVGSRIEIRSNPIARFSWSMSSVLK
jgi:hypothetical protein